MDLAVIDGVTTAILYTLAIVFALLTALTPVNAATQFVYGVFALVFLGGLILKFLAGGLGKRAVRKKFFKHWLFMTTMAFAFLLMFSNATGIRIELFPPQFPKLSEVVLGLSGIGVLVYLFNVKAKKK